MKKLVSLLFAFTVVLLFSATAFAFELPEAKLFSVSSDDEFSPEEIYSYGLKKGFNGILLDLRKTNSMDLYSEYISVVNGIEYFEIYTLVNEEHLKGLKPGKHLVFSDGISEEAFAEYSVASGSECLSFLIPFGDEKAFETAKYFYGKGYFKNLFIENLLSCHSENGYEEYLLEIAAEFPDARIITINDLGKVLSPSVKGDFYSDSFELNNQFLVNKINGFGFCVSDYSDLAANIGGRADFLTAYFDSNILDDYAEFSVPKTLSVTRPTGSKLSVATEKYSIFGTSDPEKPLYMNGEEIERISENGLFAATVDVPKKGKTYTFSQGNNSVSVTLIRGTGESTGSGTTKSLSSCFPSSSEIVSSEKRQLKLSCIGPSGGYVTAKISDKTFVLEQVAYADKGVPARFSKTVELSGNYPENEVTEIGKVTYYLSYNGKNTEYESASAIYYVGSEAKFAIKANADLAGVEEGDSDSGNYITTLRTGCTDYVSEIAENGWYKISCGGYIKPSHCDIITGKTDITCRVSSTDREIGENYEKFIIKSSDFPAFKGSISGKTFSLTLYNTEWSDFSSTDTESNLMYRINPVDNSDGSITVHFFSKVPLWGWDIFTDTENGTFSVVLKGVPTLSDDPSRPLSGITAAVCSGHGGPDPGALSIVGEKGVFESEINLANTMAIAESLEKLGAKIIPIYTQDEKLETYGRINPARYGYADVYICCHANSVAESSPANLWCGTYVYYHYDHSADFAKRLCDYISASTKRDNEGAEAGYYSVTRLTMCPAVMLEVGFVSNPSDLESMIDKRDIQKTAFAVTKAVLEICDN